MKPRILSIYFSLIFILSGIKVSNAQSFSIELYPSWYDAYNVSYFGGDDGSIDLQINGGTPPFFYHWSNGEETQDLTGLTEGYYRVDVWDGNGTYNQAEITLKQPPQKY